MARNAVNIVTQIGVETVKGTAVAAGKLLPSLAVSFKPKLGTKFYRSNGYKLANTGLLNRNSTEGSYEGPLTYSEIVYPLSGWIGCTTGPTQIGTTGAYTWIFKPASKGADAQAKSFTVQRGDAAAAQQVAYTQFTSFGYELTREECRMSGGLIAQRINNAATLTASPTEVEKRPVSANDLDVWLDATFAGIGTTKLTDVYKVSFEGPDKFGEKWVLNSANPAWSEATEIAYDPKLVVEAEYNAQMRALYDALIADVLPVRYVRIKAVGENLGTSADETFQHDLAVKLEAAEELSDLEGVYGYRFAFRVVDDATFGGSHTLTVVNKIAAL
ncbi:MAG: hypothetical protein U0Z53_23720 [Blastocatellia bacterium]